MINDKRVLAVIPARGGSKGIPHKNIVDLGGKPLIAYTIEAALQCKYIDRLIVSTDDEEIADVAKKHEAEVPFIRPEHLSSDQSKTIDALLHAVEYCEKEDGPYDVVVLLQATAPFRDGEDITNALNKYINHNEQSVVSVHKVADHPLLIRCMDESGEVSSILQMSSTVRRQEMPNYYVVNGAIYINNRSELSSETSLNDNKVGCEISEIHGIDIDDVSDLEYARWIIEKRSIGI